MADGPKLNACAAYEVYIANRGGASLVCRLPTATTLSFNRTLNDFSEARVSCKLDAACQTCLSSVNPWQHEVLIFRSSELVWCGPLTNLQYDPASSTVNVHARDLFVWTEKRFIELRGDDYDVEDVDVRQVFEWVLNHGYSKQAWGMTWSLHDTGIPISKFYPAMTGTRWGGSYRNVSSELRALSEVGVDFTVVNRHLYGGDLELVPPLPVTLKISDNNWAVAPKIDVGGTGMSTRTIVAGGSGGFYGWDEDQMWIEEDPNSQYGLLESFTERSDLGDEDTSITPNAITQEAYGRHQLLRQPIATLSEGQLAGDAPFTFDLLIPGVRIQVGLINALRTIIPDYRIYSVDVSTSPEAEVINLKLSLPGVVDVRQEGTPYAPPIPVIVVPPPKTVVPPLAPLPPPDFPIDPPPVGGGGGGDGDSGESMTTDIPAGWREEIAEDFLIDVAEGSFGSVYRPRRIDYYPVGYKDTYKRGDYSGNYISVEDGIMKQRLFVSGGRGQVSSIVPIALAGSGKWGDVLSMIWEERVRFTWSTVAAGKAGFKAAHLMWPASNNSLAHGEIDWPEMDASSGVPTKVKGYVHRVGATGYGDQTVTNPSPDIDPREWHTYRTVWIAGTSVSFYCDGVLIGTHTDRVPYTKMRLSLQNETSMANSNPLDPAATALVETDWIRVLVPVGT